MYKLIAKALHTGLTLLEWEHVRAMAETLATWELRALLWACNFVPESMDHDDMLEKLLEFLG